jgi:hypothetical protein
MWILPKQLKQLTSVSVADTEALTSDLDAASRVCARSLMRRSSAPQSNFFLREWKAGNLMLLLSGLICDLSRGRAFETAWSSSLAVIPASHSHPPVSDSEQTTSDTSGQPLQLAFGFFDQESVSLKTSRDTSPLGYGKSSMSWEQWVTERRGEYSRRAKSVRHTRESVYSFWPTCASRDYKGESGSGRQERKGHPTDTLPNAVARFGLPAPESPSTDGSRRELWPTPDATGANDGVPWEKFEQGMQERRAKLKAAVAAGKTKQGSGRSANLCAAVQNPQWATPQSRDNRSGGADRWDDPNRSRNLNDQIATVTKQNAKLNPRWVEALMGLPIGWVMPSCASPVTIEPTSCDFSETESSQQPPSELLPF